MSHFCQIFSYIVIYLSYICVQNLILIQHLTSTPFHSGCTCGWSILQSILPWMLIVTFMFLFVVYLFVVCWNHVFQLQKLYLSIAEIASFNWRNHILQLQISDLSIAEIISFNCRNHIFQLTNLYFLIAEIISFSWRACIF